MQATSRSRLRQDWRRLRQDWRACSSTDPPAQRASLAATSALPPLELVDPPQLPKEEAEAPAGKYDDWDPLEHTKQIGSRGPRRLTRRDLVDGLVQQESSGALSPSDMPLVYTVTSLFYREHLHRLLSDSRWCGAFAKAMTAAATAPTGEAARAVLVLGFGSGTPALAAARAGANVVWVERVKRFTSVMEAVAARNGLASRIRVGHVPHWSGLSQLLSQLGQQERFDVVATEEIGDTLLSEDLVALAAVAHAHLLCRGGTFLPRAVHVHGALASIRTSQVCGFDLRAFNSFRQKSALFCDAEHVCATEEGCASFLSGAAPLFSFELFSPARLPPARHKQSHRWRATRDGILNCVAYWAVLDLGGGTLHDLAPPSAPPIAGSASAGHHARPPLTVDRRALKQGTRFLGYERLLQTGDVVRLVAEHTTHSLSVDVPVDAAAERAGRLRRWPAGNLLAYHFPMIADEHRNGCFNRALVAAIGRLRSRTGGEAGAKLRALDIGSGSGLLAMMAARAGAQDVVSLEMVPALAAAARHITAANGYAEQVRVVGEMSTSASIDAIGGQFDLLVCEIVDDQLLGEGVLTTVCDARRRLLKPGAVILPRGGSLFALPVELRVPSTAGFDLTDVSTFAVDQVFSLNCPVSSAKLQNTDPAHWQALAPPIRLFDFDWAEGPLESLLEPRTSKPLPLRFDEGGLLTAFVVYFSLDLDGNPANVFSTTPENADLIAWDQSVRHLPTPCRVQAGQKVHVVAHHTEHYLKTLSIVDLQPGMLTTLGHTHVVDNPHCRNLVVSLQTRR